MIENHKMISTLSYHVESNKKQGSVTKSTRYVIKSHSVRFIQVLPSMELQISLRQPPYRVRIN